LIETLCAVFPDHRQAIKKGRPFNEAAPWNERIETKRRTLGRRRRGCGNVILHPELPAPISIAARDHGEMRLSQGYTAAMVVEESRILQVSIFSTLQRNLCTVDFSRLLLDVVTIADEVDSQLKQAMYSYVPLAALKSKTAKLAG
jgi:hypothetical protein